MKDERQESSVEVNKDRLAAQLDDLLQRAEAAVSENQRDDIEAIVAEACSIDEAALAQLDIDFARRLAGVAERLLAAGQLDSLEALFVKSFQVLSRHRKMTLADYFLPLNNLSAFYDAKGDYPARDQIFSTIVAQADKLEVHLDPRTLQAFYSLAEIYERAGSFGPAAILYRQVNRTALSRPEYSEESLVYFIGKHANALAAADNAKAAIEVCEQSLAVLESRTEVSGFLRGQVLALVAQYAQGSGDLEQAQVYWEQARDCIENSKGKDSSLAGDIVHSLAVVLMARRTEGWANQAEALLERACDIVAKNQSRQSSEYAGEVAQLANVVSEKGEIGRAVKLFEEALSIYEADADCNRDHYAAFLLDAGFLYLRQQRPEDAILVFERAREVRESIPDASLWDKANAVSSLATARFVSGDLEQSIEDYRAAIALRHQCAEFVAGVS